MASLMNCRVFLSMDIDLDFELFIAVAPKIPKNTYICSGLYTCRRLRFMVFMASHISASLSTQENTRITTEWSLSHSVHVIGKLFIRFGTRKTGVSMINVHAFYPIRSHVRRSIHVY